MNKDSRIVKVTVWRSSDGANHDTQATAVLKQAIEALESVVASNYGRYWIWPATAHESAMVHTREAITALRQAISHQPAGLQGVHKLHARNILYSHCLGASLKRSIQSNAPTATSSRLCQS